MKIANLWIVSQCQIRSLSSIYPAFRQSEAQTISGVLLLCAATALYIDVALISVQLFFSLRVRLIFLVKHRLRVSCARM